MSAALSALLASAAVAQESTPEPPPHFADHIAVERILLDVRIVDSAGRPVLGLRPPDIAVSVDGSRAVVDSLRWVPGATPFSEGLSPEAAALAVITTQSAIIHAIPMPNNFIASPSNHRRKWPRAPR